VFAPVEPRLECSAYFPPALCDASSVLTPGVRTNPRLSTGEACETRRLVMIVRSRCAKPWCGLFDESDVCIFPSLEYPVKLRLKLNATLVVRQLRVQLSLIEIIRSRYRGCDSLH
jgi:hypothetical protein